MISAKTIDLNVAPPSALSPICRIPVALQKVFVESNQGAEVHNPPSNNIASKVFESDEKCVGGGKRRRWKSPIKAKGALRDFISFVPSLYIPIDSPRKRKVRTALSKTAPSNTCKSPSKTTLNKNLTVKKTKKPLPTLSPQDYLDGLLRSRGYSSLRYAALQTGYYVKGTLFQKASYGNHIANIIKTGDSNKLRTLLKCGLSSNPCNDFGESLVHMTCRLGNASILNTMLEFDCSIQIADDSGRTPLHEACRSSSPCFELIEILLEQDSRLFHIADARNALPLSFAPRECWTEWLQFIASKKDIFWPKRNIAKDGIQSPPPLTLVGPNGPRVYDTPKVTPLPIQMANLVATGRVDPNEANFLSLISCIDDDSLTDSDEYDDESDDSSSCSYNESSEETDVDSSNSDDVTESDDSIKELEDIDEKPEYFDSPRSNESYADDDKTISLDFDDDSSSLHPIQDDKESNDSSIRIDNQNYSSKANASSTEFLLDENEMSDILKHFDGTNKSVNPNFPLPKRISWTYRKY